MDNEPEELKPLTYEEFVNAINAIRYEEQAKKILIPVHPDLWNGYWHVQSRFGVLGRLCRTLGRKLHWVRLYSLGRKVFWVIGLKEYIEIMKEENSEGME